MEYIVKAFSQADHLFVGLTQPNIRDLLPTPSASHRSDHYANPLTYFERQRLITEALLDGGYPRERFDIIPFPIETPELLPDFLSTSVVCLTTVYDEWNRDKVRRLQGVGYEVVVLWDRDVKTYQGSVVRDAIRLADPVLAAMVPPATERAVQSLHLAERLSELWPDNAK